jgi:putative ABC transport system permease protein
MNPAHLGIASLGVTRSELVHLIIGVLVLLGVTYAVLRAAGVRIGWAPATALGRGAVQLAAVGIALRGVLSYPPTVVIALAVMLGTAVWTAGGRLAPLAHARRAALIACTLGAGISLTVVFALRMLPFQARYLVAIGGIVIGATMTGATLAGRHLVSGLRARRDEVEAWLSIGASMRQAVSDIARAASAEALVPGLDQTRTTGLVTLPGAFIGALLGGSSPVQAARFQLIVLAAILACQAVVAVTVTYLLGAPATLPADVAMPRR